MLSFITGMICQNQVCGLSLIYQHPLKISLPWPLSAVIAFGVEVDLPPIQRQAACLPLALIIPQITVVLPFSVEKIHLLW